MGTSGPKFSADLSQKAACRDVRLLEKSNRIMENIYREKIRDFFVVSKCYLKGQMKEDRRGMWHEWGLRGIHTVLQLGSLKKRGHLEGLSVCGR
jgi:hypothetical protein